MKRIEKPTDKVEAILADCISNINNKAKKDRIAAISNNLTLLENEYNDKAAEERLDEIIPHENIQDVTKDELKNLYTEKMVDDNQPGRVYYDRIKSSAPLNICPFCETGVVRQVDHVLPKSFYPGLSITPYNLVPVCRDCNTDKRNPTVRSPDQIHLHPYFDNVDDEQWLIAEITHTTPIIITFKTQRIESWSNLLNNRIEWHFEVFKLNSMYSILGGAAINNLRYLKELHASGGSSEVREHLDSIANGMLQVGKNKWETAMYVTLAKSNWFCNTGVQNL